jgi:thiamine biosynthesis lipoprotein
MPNRRRRYFVAALTALLLLFTSACSRESDAYHEQFIGFGTLIDVKLWGVGDEAGRKAVHAIDDDFKYMHYAWHAWNPGPLNRVNKLLSSGDRFSIAPSLIPLIKKAKELEHDSRGKFNPAIGQLLKLWGFESDDPPHGPPPSPEAIQELLDKKPSMDDVVLDGIDIYCKNPAVKMDFGGFAKGYGVDRVIDHLREMGIHNAVVNAGGNMRVIGRHGNRPWRIGIRNPRAQGIIASIDVQGDVSISTSGDYERFFEYKGIRYHHILDPRTGYPARGATSVTVFDDNGADADAASTAIFIAGPEDWYETAKAMGVKGVMMVDWRGTVYMTPNLKDRLYIDAKPLPKIVYSDPL